MAAEETEAVPLAEGVKCPYCLWGVFRLKSKVLAAPDGNPDGVQTWFWKCSSNELHKCRTPYYPDYSEMEGAYYAVQNGRVTIIRPIRNVK